jgi:hypothetical protein
VLAFFDIEDDSVSDRRLRIRSSKRSASSSRYSTGRSNNRRKKARTFVSKSNALSISGGFESQTNSNSLQKLPLIVGKTYLRIEDINLDELLVRLL